MFDFVETMFDNEIIAFVVFRGHGLTDTGLNDIGTLRQTVEHHVASKPNFCLLED
jgi:hypothetical protein